jgi:hypothetical protein
MRKPRNEGRFKPPSRRTPTHDEWCFACTYPDPGVAEHTSHFWADHGSPVDPDARWQICVTQRYVDGAPERAIVYVDGVSGGFDHAGTQILAAALREAQALADALNVGIPLRERAVS